MKTILLVEDEIAIVEPLTDILTWEGYEVLSAPNGKEGLAALAEAKVDLVLLDYMMPILDGGEVLRAMRASPAMKDIPVIIMTAAPQALPEDVRRAVPVLTKPFDLGELLDMVAKYLPL